jgi:four helix bundle protein
VHEKQKDARGFTIKRHRGDMSDFKKLRVWAHAQSLMINVDRTARTIRNADYAPLRRQLIKTAQSITANIVEGREKESQAEFAHHLGIAKGSVSELEEHLISARDLDLISESDVRSLTDQLRDVRKMLTGLIKCLRKSIKEKKDSKNARRPKRDADSD